MYLRLSCFLWVSQLVSWEWWQRLTCDSFALDMFNKKRTSTHQWTFQCQALRDHKTTPVRYCHWSFDPAKPCARQPRKARTVLKWRSRAWAEIKETSVSIPLHQYLESAQICGPHLVHSAARSLYHRLNPLFQHPDHKPNERGWGSSGVYPDKARGI